MERTSCILLVLLFISYLSLANGGPVDFASIHKTGNIRLIHEADIQLVAEKIHVKVTGDYSQVKVEYTLKNHSAAKKVQYGFPIDYYPLELGDYFPSSVRKKVVNGFRVDYIKSFEIQDAEQPLASNYIATKYKYFSKVWDSHFGRNKHPKYYKTLSYFVDEDSISRRWYLTDLAFADHETKKVTVKYEVLNSYTDAEIGFYMYYSKRRFSYDLSPSKHWGDGVVKDFELTIDFLDQSTLQSEHGLYGVTGYSQTKTGYQLVSKNFDLKQFKIFHLLYDNRCYKESELLLESLRYPIPSSKTTQEAIKPIFDGDIDTEYRWNLKQDSIFHLRTKLTTFRRLNLINTHALPVKLKIGVLISPNQDPKGEKRWQYFIIDMQQVCFEPADMRNHTYCDVKNLMWYDGFEGQYSLYGLKVEVVYNQFNYTEIPLPEFLFSGI